MIVPTVVRSAYVLPALHRLNLYSPSAERLLMGTAAVESNFNNFVQFGGGPARGMFQMEPPTFHDMLDRFLSLKSREALRAAVVATDNDKTPAFLDLTNNHLFSAAMARVKYYSIHAPIPSSLEDQAHYWWTYYNGRSPHGLKPKDYIASWRKYCESIYK
jgi:hypothetical protein